MHILISLPGETEDQANEVFAATVAKAISRRVSENLKEDIDEFHSTIAELNHHVAELSQKLEDSESDMADLYCQLELVQCSNQALRWRVNELLNKQPSSPQEHPTTLP